MKRFATGHRDANHKPITDVFERCGCTVIDLSGVGDGVPDLLIGVLGRTFLVEVKDGSKPPSRRRLRKTQKGFALVWGGSPVHVVETVQQAWDLAQLMRMPKGTP